VPTKKGVGLEDEERFSPILHPTGEEDQPEAIGLRKGWLFDLAVKEDQLLPEESILGDEIRFGAGEVSGDAERQ
jgi:hypothetical protein